MSESITVTLLALLPVYPLVSFVLLISFAKRLSWHVAATISVGAMVLSALSSFVVIEQLSVDVPVITAHLWLWFTLSSSEQVNISFYLDGLAAVMICVVTGIGLLIHI